MKYFILSIILVFFTGCNVSKQIVGEFYLQNNSFSDGSKHFKDALKDNKNSDINHYYYARFLLANKKTKESLFHFNKAISINPNSSEYYTWQGIAYGTLNKLQKENSAYKKALALDKKNIQALTYLGHNYFELKQYEKAIQTYELALKLDEFNQTAQYNIALSLNKLNRIPEEIDGFKKYLEYYPSGYLAKKAVDFLNVRGNFEYRNYLIGFKNITLKKISFKPLSKELTDEAKESLDVLGRLLTLYKKKSIHIVAYQLNNEKLAKDKAIAIKKYLLSTFDDIDSKRLKLSWFGKSKILKIKNKKYTLMEATDFITVVEKDSRR